MLPKRDDFFPGTDFCGTETKRALGENGGTRFSRSVLTARAKIVTYTPIDLSVNPLAKEAMKLREVNSVEAAVLPLPNG